MLAGFLLVKKRRWVREADVTTMQGSSFKTNGLGPSTRILKILGTLVLILFANIGYSAIHNLSAVDQGWYNSAGSHSTINTNTATGLLGTTEYRAWFKFTLPEECKDGVQSGTLTVESVFQSRGAGAIPHNMSVNDVSLTNIADLGVTAPSVPIFNDIGNGQIGNFSIAGNGDFTESAALNAAALNAMETAAATASRAYGAGLRHLAPVGTVYVMGYSQAAFVTGTLTINCAPDTTLTLQKTLVNDHGGTAVLTDFIPSISGTATNWGTAVTLAPGNYSASESSVAGYVAGNWGGDCDSAGNITLAAGQNAVCTIQNDDKPAELTLVKTVSNNHGGSAVASDFTPYINGVAATWGTAIQLAAGVYTASESNLTGYQAGVWKGDCNSDGTIKLSLAEIATCEITNRDLGVNLEIQKSASNKTPDIGDVVTFTLSASNSGPDVATNVLVTDIVMAGFDYQPASISGGDIRNDSDPGGTGLQWTISSLPVGSSAVLQFSATVKSP